MSDREAAPDETPAEHVEEAKTMAGSEMAAEPETAAGADEALSDSGEQAETEAPAAEN